MRKNRIRIIIKDIDGKQYMYEGIRNKRQGAELEDLMRKWC